MQHHQLASDRDRVQVDSSVKNHTGKTRKPRHEWEDCFYASKDAALQISESAVTAEPGMPSRGPNSAPCFLEETETFRGAEGLALSRTPLEGEEVEHLQGHTLCDSDTTLTDLTLNSYMTR